MKKLLMLIGLVASVVLGTSAADYEMFIKKGLEWKELWTSTSVTPDHNHLPKLITIYSLENELEYDGMTVLGLYSQNQGICCDYYAEAVKDEKTLIAYMRTDGDKVYYHPLWDVESNWYLMYDFSLGIDEGCDVYPLLKYKHNMEGQKSYVYCKEITENATYGRVWEIMEMREKLSEEYECAGKWLRGLGDNRGIASPNGYDLVGGGSLMFEASYNGEIIYKNYPAGIEIPETETLQVCVQGNQVWVLGVSGRSEVYSSDGRLAGCTYGDAPLILGNGLYIVRHGNKSHKVVL